MKPRSLTVPVKRLLLLGMLLFVIFHMEPQLASGYSFSSPQPVETIPGIDQDPSALQASNGTLWVAWDSAHTGINEIFYSTSNGGTWSNANNATSGPPNVSNASPALGQLQNGTIILVWTGNQTGHFNLYYKLFNGVRWTGDFQLTEGCPATSCIISNSPDVGDMSPVTARTPDSTLWVFWDRDNFTFNPSCPFHMCRQIFYKTLKSNVWSGETQLTTDATWNQMPALTVGTKDGMIRVAYSKWSVKGQFYNIFYRTLSGGQWSSEVQLTSTNTFDGDTQPDLVQDRNGTLWLFWSRQVAFNATITQHEIFYENSPDGGTSWSKTVQLTSGGNINTPIDNFSPSAVQGVDRNLWIFYSSDNPVKSTGDFNIFYIKTLIWPVHDLAVTKLQVSPLKIFPWNVVGINVTVADPGDFIENVQLSVQAVAGASVLNIASFSFFLAGGGSKALTINWNATGSAPGRYTVVASVPVLSGETPANAVDNSLSVNGLNIYIPGDLDKNGCVDTLDASIILFSYGTTVGSPGFNPDADLNRDGTINIIDLGMWGASFGRCI